MKWYPHVLSSATIELNNSSLFPPHWCENIGRVSASIFGTHGAHTLSLVSFFVNYAIENLKNSISSSLLVMHGSSSSMLSTFSAISSESDSLSLRYSWWISVWPDSSEFSRPLHVQQLCTFLHGLRLIDGDDEWKPFAFLKARISHLMTLIVRQCC